MCTDDTEIEPGIGIGACRVGGIPENASEEFGTPDPVAEGLEEYRTFSTKGFELCLEDGLIHTIFLHFTDADYSPFAGATREGIGANSTVEDVVAKHGEPTDKSGTSQLDLTYRDQGIGFVFEQDRLSIIRVFSPTKNPWPLEWPQPEIGEELFWLTLAPEDLYATTMHAQSTYQEFASIVDLEEFKILPSIPTIAAKVFLSSPQQPMVGEHLFLVDLSCDRESIIGTVNADSMYHDDLKEGDVIRVPASRLSDWFLVSAKEQAIGGFSMNHVLSEVPEQEREHVIGEAPFSWFTYRGVLDAWDQLVALSVCTSCERRSLLASEPFVTEAKPTCGFCENGIQRTACDECGTQILRPENLPGRCAGCLNGRPVPTWEATTSEPRKAKGFLNKLKFWD